MDPKTIEYYSENSEVIATRYESIVNGLAAYFELAFAKSSRILDIGCGSGRDMAYLARLGKSVFGIDATAKLIDLAQTLHPELHGKIQHAAVPTSSVPFGGGFDGVLCSAVLMHIPVELQPETVRFIAQCMVHGGNLLYSIPSKRSDVAQGSDRDASGRLFISNNQYQLQRLFEEQGFVLLNRWESTDSLGRDGVEWVSFLMQFRSR